MVGLTVERSRTQTSSRSGSISRSRDGHESPALVFDRFLLQVHPSTVHKTMVASSTPGSQIKPRRIKTKTRKKRKSRHASKKTASKGPVRLRRQNSRARRRQGYASKRATKTSSKFKRLARTADYQRRNRSARTRTRETGSMTPSESMSISTEVKRQRRRKKHKTMSKSRSTQVANRNTYEYIHRAATKRASRSRPGTPRKKKRTSKKTNKRLTSVKGRRLSRLDIQISALLGEGAFSKVYLASWNLKRSTVKKSVPLELQTKKLAVKVMERKKSKSHLAEEKVLKDLDHPFIAKYYGSITDLLRVYLLLEYSIGGELLYHFESSEQGYFDIAVCRFFVGEIICALDYLHGKGFIYRDLKPENVLLDKDGHIKLIDFGFAKQLKTSSGHLNRKTIPLTQSAANKLYRTNTLCGSKEYIAPEVLLGQGYSFEVDFWSLGVLMYELMCGELPFATQDCAPLEVIQVIVQTCQGELEFPDHVECEPAKDFVKGLIMLDPNFRLGSLRGFRDLKKHLFFTEAGFDWKKCNQRKLSPPIVPSFTSSDDISNFENSKFEQSVSGGGSSVDILRLEF